MIDFFQFLWVWIGLAVFTLLALVITGIRAPYGRHSSANWGPLTSNRWGWIIMEIPALVLCPTLAFIGPEELATSSLIMVLLWIGHYTNRTIIYPLRIKTQGKKMPVFIVVSALIFNGVNGFINGYYLGFIGTDGHLITSVHVVIGIMLFFAGMTINIRSDNYLISLRKRHSGYQIPQGGLFKYVSCPNHFGEILEWTGFAVIGWNLPAASFAIWTFCNLVPRALNHHSWYKLKFRDYPKRWAVIPYIW